MGCGCNFGKSEQNIELLNEELGKIEEKIKGDYSLLRALIKLQSTIKGFLFRKNFKITNKLERSKVNETNIDAEADIESDMSKTSNCHQHPTELITEEELNKLMKEYPPLKDGVKVEINGPLMFENNNAIYFGEWDFATNKKHGRGIQLWNEGSKYYGYWIKDKASIKGKLIHFDGDIYDGEWSEDKPNGKGVYIHIDGTVYTGDWKDDKQHGKGKEVWPDGAWYEGDYFEGKKHGKGKFFWKDNSSYEGMFKNNNINGEGEYTFSDKRKYIGSWVDNKLDGKGVFTWPDGRKYVGEYKNDKKEGYGTFYWNDGKIYEGFWKNGKQDGEGKLYNPQEKIWKKGIWQNGKRITWIEDKQPFFYVN
jgi:hypothetical protein